VLIRLGFGPQVFLPGTAGTNGPHNPMAAEKLIMTTGRKPLLPLPLRVLRCAMLAILLAGSVFRPGLRAADDDKNDDQTQKRLAWMRENQTGMWNISPREGLYLYDLVVKHHLKHGLEIGTSNGYSGIWIASGMRVTGGRLLTMEIDEERAQLARENLQAAGVERYVTLERVDALQAVPKLTGPYDFVFIDAEKSDYIRYLQMVLPLVPEGGVIVAHNVSDMADELHDFIVRVKTDPELKTTFAEPGPGGFSVSIKRGGQ
jgi:predicted O-methyltransferase YrrM